MIVALDAAGDAVEQWLGGDVSVSSACRWQWLGGDVSV